MWYASSRTGFYDGTAQLLGGAPVLATTNPMVIMHPGAAAAPGEFCYLVIPTLATGVWGSSTYSVCVRTVTFLGHDSFALPLRVIPERSVAEYATSIPNTLAILWLHTDGFWVGHTPDMPVGVYDNPVLPGTGYQLAASPVPAKFSFVGR